MTMNSQPHGAIQYRPDIDGLRALAVLSVILFHIDESALPGGFLGVDIFFVISGYLITLLLVKEIGQSGRIDLVNFYRRRAQRILPALMLVLSVSGIAGFMLLTPSDFKNLMAASFAAMLSAANIYFYSAVDTSYFASDSAELPLLHLWSLGVEEQYYLLWPLVVLSLVKYTRRPVLRIGLILFVAAVSLALAQWMLGKDESFAYYMLPTRAWELSLGGLMAFLVAEGMSLQRRAAEACGAAGILLVGASFVLVNQNHDVPGVSALPAVLGAGLVIASNGQTVVGRVLGSKPFVAIGLISYSAYLWHWPLLAYLRYTFVEISLLVGAAAFVVTLLMAALSYRVVEMPLRYLKLERRDVFIRYFGVPVAALFIAWVTIAQVVNNEVGTIYPWERYANLESSMRPAYEYDFNCQYANFSREAFSEARCVFPEQANPRVLLLGDSNGAHYLGMLHVFANRYGFSMRNATQSACPPILSNEELSWVSRRYAPGCRKYRAVAQREVGKYDVVLLGGSWNSYDRTGKAEFRRMFEATVADLSRRVSSVVILENVPIFPGYSRECERRSVRLSLLDCRRHFAQESSVETSNAFLHELAGRYGNVHFFEVSHALCQNRECSPYLDGAPVYFNASHLSMEGSARIGERLVSSRDQGLEHLAQVIGRSNVDVAGLPKNMARPQTVN